MTSFIKQKWGQTSGFFDFKKALTAADGIRHTFTLERGVDLHPDQWDHIVYHLIKDALLEPFSIIIGPNNRPYLQVYIPSREEVEIMIKENDGVKINASHSPKIKTVGSADTITYKNFPSVCKAAVDSYAGLALYSTKDQQVPNMTIKFGALYSYLQYGDVGGPPQLVDNMIQAIRTNPHNPKHAIADYNDMTYVEGEPSDAFLNEFIRICIRQELRKHTHNDNLDVVFTLREQNMYVMRHMILIETHPDLSNHEKRDTLMQNLCWYMPLFLPLALKTDKEIISYSD